MPPDLYKDLPLIATGLYKHLPLIATGLYKDHFDRKKRNCGLKAITSTQSCMGHSDLHIAGLVGWLEIFRSQRQEENDVPFSDSQKITKQA